MSETKTIVISEIKSNDKFHNIKDNTGIEYGISREKSPLLSKILDSAKVGDEIKGDYFLWKDKHYLSDSKETSKGGAKYTAAPKDKSFDAGIAAATATAKHLAMTKDATVEMITGTFKLYHELIMGTVTK